MRDLEAQNSQLRRDLANYNDTTKLLMDSQDLDGLTKPELAARYGTVYLSPVGSCCLFDSDGLTFADSCRSFDSGAETETDWSDERVTQLQGARATSTK